MTLAKAIDYFKKSVFSKEEIERYVPYKDCIVLITKGEDYEYEDDFIIGDVVYFLVHPSGRVQPITPADCDFSFDAIKHV